MTTMPQSQTRFCSVCARQAGLQPAGHADSYDHALVLEVPLPWPSMMLVEPDTLPTDVLDLVRVMYYERPADTPLRMRFLAIAPDKDYARPGYRRVISFRRPVGPCAAFTRAEYLVPEAQFGALAWALTLQPERLPDFAAYRQSQDTTRDLMVCTQGTVDAACAKFGFPIYRRLRAQANEHLRVWRVSHFGGHVFAPTVLDLPEARYWGYIGPDEAGILAERGDIERLAGCYRGWAAFDAPALQAAERALLLRHGWPWVSYLKQGRVLDQDSNARLNVYGHAEPSWAEVRIDYASPDGIARGAYIMRVERTHWIENMHSTNTPETYAYAQYEITRLIPLQIADCRLQIVDCPGPF